MLKNTVILGTATATIGTILALVIAYVTTRKAIAGSRVLGFLATAPVAVPGIVLGVGLFLSYTRPPLVLYGTLWILLLAFLTINLPSAYQQLQAAFATIHPELEDASRILGATRLQSLIQITAPLLRTGVIATWCFIFIGVMRELSAAIVLFTSQTKVLSRPDLRPQRKRRPRRDLGARHRHAGDHLRGGHGGEPDPGIRRRRCRGEIAEFSSGFVGGGQSEACPPSRARLTWWCFARIRALPTLQIANPLRYKAGPKHNEDRVTQPSPRPLPCRRRSRRAGRIP